jgi:hypothetical protein
MVVVCYVTPYSPVDVAEELVSACFYPEDGNRRFLRKFDTHLPDYTTSLGGQATKVLSIPVHIFNMSSGKFLLTYFRDWKFDRDYFIFVMWQTIRNL